MTQDFDSAVDESDWELLQRYIREQSDDSFSALVQRHGALVYATALRHLRDVHLAEDVTQTVFHLLASKGAELNQAVVLGGWLYRTACFVSARTRRDLNRAALKESLAAQEGTAVDEQAQLARELALVLDEALSKLPEIDRNAIILRYLEGLPFSEVACALGLADAAARKRLPRALEKLRAALRRLGVLLPAAGLVTLLEQQSKAVLPAKLAARCIRERAAAVSFDSPPELPRVRQFVTPLRVGVLAILCCSMLVATSRKTAHDTAAEPRTAEAGVQQPSRSEPARFAAARSENGPLESISFRVLTSESDSPLPEAIAHLYAPEEESGMFRADRNGEILVRLPQPFHSMGIRFGAPGRVAKHLLWTEREAVSLPRSYAVRLERGQTVSGLVLDPEGHPVGGVRLRLFNRHGGKSNEGRGSNSDLEDFAPVTDQNGRWESACQSDDLKVLNGIMEHPAYADTPFEQPVPDNKFVTLRIDRGKPITGVLAVIGTSAPIPDAQVQLEVDESIMFNRWTNRTDGSGVFTFDRIPPGQFRLYIEVPGYFRTNVTIIHYDYETNLAVALTPFPPAGRGVLRGRVVDENGKPYSGSVSAPGWEQTLSAEGRFEWLEAPDGSGTVEVSVGWNHERRLELPTDGVEREIRIPQKPRLIIEGKVRDAATGALLPLASLTLQSPQGHTWSGPEFMGEAYDGQFKLSIEHERLLWPLTPITKEDMRYRDPAFLIVRAEGFREKKVALPIQTNDMQLQIELERIHGAQD